MNLQEIINKMNLPAARRDLNKIENIFWLDRNMGIRNGEDENFLAARAGIRELIKKHSKEMAAKIKFDS